MDHRAKTMKLTGWEKALPFKHQQEPGKMIHGKIMDDLNRLKRIGSKAEAGVLPNRLDVENRLASCESAATVPQASKPKERWTYYADGRWKERVIYTNNSVTWIATSTNRYVWDAT